MAKAQYDHGTLKKIDYQTLQINLANKESQLHQQQTQYNEQLTRFNYLVGLPATANTLLQDDPALVNKLLIPENEVPQRAELKLYQQLHLV